jgi:hypothetical protein
MSGCSDRPHATRILPHLHSLLPLCRISPLTQSYSSYITLARDLYEGIGLLAFFYLMLSFIAYDHEKVTPA